MPCSQGIRAPVCLVAYYTSWGFLLTHHTLLFPMHRKRPLET